jgi:hypothetical protein
MELIECTNLGLRRVIVSDPEQDGTVVEYKELARLVWKTEMEMDEHHSFLDSEIDTDGVIDSVSWWGPYGVIAHASICDWNRICEIEPVIGPLKFRHMFNCEEDIWLPKFRVQLSTIGGTFVTIRPNRRPSPLPTSTGMKKIGFLSYTPPQCVLSGEDYDQRRSLDQGEYRTKNEFGAVYVSQKQIDFTDYTGVSCPGIPQPEEETQTYGYNGHKQRDSNEKDYGKRRFKVIPFKPWEGRDGSTGERKTTPKYGRDDHEKPKGQKPKTKSDNNYKQQKRTPPSKK